MTKRATAVERAPTKRLPARDRATYRVPFCGLCGVQWRKEGFHGGTDGGTDIFTPDCECWRRAHLPVGVGAAPSLDTFLRELFQHDVSCPEVAWDAERGEYDLDWMAPEHTVSATLYAGGLAWARLIGSDDSAHGSTLEGLVEAVEAFDRAAHTSPPDAQQLGDILERAEMAGSWWECVAAVREARAALTSYTSEEL